MIPKLFIEQWQKNAPWQTLDMVEQDLIINRALVDLYGNQKVKDSLIFRVEPHSIKFISNHQRVTVKI